MNTEEKMLEKDVLKQTFEYNNKIKDFVNKKNKAVDDFKQKKDFYENEVFIKLELIDILIIL